MGIVKYCCHDTYSGARRAYKGRKVGIVGGIHNAVHKLSNLHSGDVGSLYMVPLDNLFDHRIYLG